MVSSVVRRLLQIWGMGQDSELAHEHLSRETDALGERREGELQLGDVLDPHPGRHAGGDVLNNLGRVLAEHVRADDPARPVSTISLQNPSGWPSATGRSRSS